MCYQNVFPTVEELTDMDYCTRSLSKLKGVTFCSLNIRSLYKNFDSLKQLLNRADVDCLILNETYLNSSILYIPGYEFIRFDRTEASGKKCGGGWGPISIRSMILN